MDMKGSNQSLVKTTNQNLILQEVRCCQKLSRSELAKRLQLSNPSVSKHVDDLLSKGLLVETGSIVTDVGRRPIMLEFNGTHGCVAVIDLSQSNARLCVADLRGNKLEYSRVDGDRLITEDELNRIIVTLHDMLGQLGDRCGGLLGICVGVPGLVEPESGRIVQSPRFSSEAEAPDLNGMLREAFNVPVIVRNDISLAVVGEHKFGAGQEHSSLLLLNIDDAFVGLGAVLGGTTYEGAKGYACDIDSVMFPSADEPSEPISLSEVLRLDRLVSNVRRIISDGRESLLKEWTSDPSELLFDDIARAWGMSDVVASTMVRRYARTVAFVCRSLTALFDPELILLGGQVTRLGPPFVAEVCRLYDTFPGQPAELQLARLSDSAVIFGGIDLATIRAIDRIVSQ